MHEIGRRMKAELRDRMRRVRKAIGDEGRRERSAKIAAHVLALPQWKDAKTVALFVPMRTEVDVTLLRDAALEAGKTIAAPRMIELASDDPTMPPRLSLELRSWGADIEPIESGKMVKEPPESAPLVSPESVDLVIVPALALDPSGGRVGYGAGLYDGLLPTLTRAFFVAVAYEFQLVVELPLAPHDRRVHHIVTDERSVAATGSPP
jgi:5-formyltetrahydrofolate cyclo-ligase